MPRHNSPIDWKKVMEGRAIVNDEDIKDAPIVHKMFVLFDKRPDLVEGLSVNELALILFEKETYYDKPRKRWLPDKFAYNKANRYITILNKWIMNKSLAVYASVNKEGSWRFFNKTKMQDFRDSEKIATCIVNGINTQQEKAKKIIKTPTKTKTKNSSETRRLIRMMSNERKRKRRGGDDNHIA